MSRYHEVPSAPEYKEEEKRPETKVILYFLRHEKRAPAMPGQPDVELELLPEARAAAIKRGKEKPAQPEVAYAAGSPRIRSAHTALLRMMAGKETITQEMTFAQAKAEAEKELKYGKKVIHLPELDFNWGTVPEIQKRGPEAFKAGRALEFLLKESDELTRQLKDKGFLSYSRRAANYASLIAKGMRVGNNFNRIVAREPDKYKQYGNQLERYFGTHQTVSECFYMKVLEKLYGRKKAEEFIESFRDEKGRAEGFGYEEGFEIRIMNGSKGQKVVLEGVRGFPDMELTPKLLSDIIEDAEKLDEKTKD